MPDWSELTYGHWVGLGVLSYHVFLTLIWIVFKLTMRRRVAPVRQQRHPYLDTGNDLITRIIISTRFGRALILPLTH